MLPEEAEELRVLEVAVLVYLRQEGLERALDAFRCRLRLLLVTTFFCFRFVSIRFCLVFVRYFFLWFT